MNDLDWSWFGLNSKIKTQHFVAGSLQIWGISEKMGFFWSVWPRAGPGHSHDGINFVKTFDQFLHILIFSKVFRNSDQSFPDQGLWNQNFQEERIWLKFSGITILMSLTVFLNMVVEIMPVTSDNPLLGIRSTFPASSSPSTRISPSSPSQVPQPTCYWNMAVGEPDYSSPWRKELPITRGHESCSGTYFNCIMFMVASSVVTTIMILNYHHRLADTQPMPNWVVINHHDDRFWLWELWWQQIR